MWDFNDRIGDIMTWDEIINKAQIDPLGVSTGHISRMATELSEKYTHEEVDKLLETAVENERNLMQLEISQQRDAIAEIIKKSYNTDSGVFIYEYLEIADKIINLSKGEK